MTRRNDPLRYYPLDQKPFVLGEYGMPFMLSKSQPGPSRGDSKVIGAVVHTTGWGPVRRYLAAKRGYTEGQLRSFGAAVGSPFDHALWLYAFAMEEGPHFLVCGASGRAVQLLPTDLVAWGVGSANAHRYDQAGWYRGAVNCKWWLGWADEYDITSPMDLPVWAGGKCNPNVVNIEVVPPALSAAKVGEPWSDRACQVVAEILGKVVNRYDIEVDERHILTHSQANPLARTAKGQPWDLGPKQAEQLRDIIETMRAAVKS